MTEKRQFWQTGWLVDGFTLRILYLELESPKRLEYAVFPLFIAQPFSAHCQLDTTGWLLGSSLQWVCMAGTAVYTILHLTTCIQYNCDICMSVSLSRQSEVLEGRSGSDSAVHTSPTIPLTVSPLYKTWYIVQPSQSSWEKEAGINVNSWTCIVLFRGVKFVETCCQCHLISIATIIRWIDICIWIFKPVSMYFSLHVVMLSVGVSTEEVRHACTNHYKFSAFAWTLSRDHNDINALNL